jgi:hypothetical protein
MTMINHNDGNDVEAGSSGMRHIPTAACSDKHQARPPMDHFMRLLEEAYPSHAYRIRHKLKDCSMMRSSMTSGSLTKGVELDEGLDGSVMMVYGGCPPSGRHCVSNLSPRAATHGG